MSKSFYIKNKKKFLFYEKVMTINELLDIDDTKQLKTFFEYSFDDANFDYKKFYDSRLDNYECFLFGVENKSFRGMYFSYDKKKKSYVITLYTPSSEEDWILALNYMKCLSKKLNSNIISEDEEIFTAENINTFNYKFDISVGIKSIFRHTKNSEDSINTIFGVNYPINFDHKLITKFINSDNKIKEFSEFCRNIQYLDTAIFRQKQSFYKIENSLKVYGTYILLENFKQILPYKPNIEFPYLKKTGEKDIAYWDISFCIEKSPKKYEEIGRIYYEDFIQKLPKNKYKFIDATYILIEPLNKKEIYKILDYYELNKSK